MTDSDTPLRWKLIRDIAVFQFKLICDGFRDLLLVPISLIVGVYSVIKGGARPGDEFYELLRVGHRSERWINLFGAAEDFHGPFGDDDRFNTRDIDEMVAHVENFIVDEYHKGGVTAQAKKRLDQAIDSLTAVATRNKSEERPAEDEASD